MFIGSCQVDLVARFASVRIRFGKWSIASGFGIRIVGRQFRPLAVTDCAPSHLLARLAGGIVLVNSAGNEQTVIARATGQNHGTEQNRYQS